MVVDCGGGTVDITVHEVSNKQGHIKEVFKATGGPYGSTSNISIQISNVVNFCNYLSLQVLTQHLKVYCALCLEMS